MLKEKLVEWFLTTPLARRYVAGYAERGLVVALTLLAGAAGLEAGTFESDVANAAAYLAPPIAATVIWYVGKVRMKKAEKTIQVAQASAADRPREQIDAEAKVRLKLKA